MFRHGAHCSDASTIFGEWSSTVNVNHDRSLNVAESFMKQSTRSVSQRPVFIYRERERQTSVSSNVTRVSAPQRTAREPNVVNQAHSLAHVTHTRSAGHHTSPECNAIAALWSLSVRSCNTRTQRIRSIFRILYKTKEMLSPPCHRLRCVSSCTLRKCSWVMRRWCRDRAQYNRLYWSV